MYYHIRCFNNISGCPIMTFHFQKLNLSGNMSCNYKGMAWMSNYIQIIVNECYSMKTPWAQCWLGTSLRAKYTAIIYFIALCGKKFLCNTLNRHVIKENNDIYIYIFVVDIIRERHLQWLILYPRINQNTLNWEWPVIYEIYGTVLMRYELKAIMWFNTRVIGFSCQ